LQLPREAGPVRVAGRRLLLEPIELAVQDGTLKFPQTIVPRDHVMLVPDPALCAATVLDRPGGGGQRLVVGRDDASFAGRQVLARLERERRQLPKGADGAGTVRRAMGMRRVFDQHEAVSIGEALESVHVGRLPGEMNRDDRPRARRDRRLDGLRIEGEGVEIDVGKNRYGVRFDDRRRSRQKRVRRHDDLIFRLDSQREQRDSQRDRAVDDRHTMPAAVHRSKAPLELLDLVTVEPSPLAAAERAQQAVFFRLAEDGPGGKRSCTDRRSAEQCEQVETFE
jgi:hypothetical protein